MKINFKKVSAIAASALMVGLSMGSAVAAQNYPNPFVISGAANVAIVYGTGTGVSSLDLVQAGNIQSNLQSFMTGTSGGGASVSGESAELATSGTRIYVNDSLNKVKTALTRSNLPTVLADGSFSGNVDSSITQTIDIGSNPRITFKRQPTSSDDPSYALTTSTTQANYIYNTTATFSKAINFSHSDSEGEDINLFGMDFTISSSTDGDTIVLLKSAEKLSLTSDAPTAEVTIAGATYTIELVSASDSAATISVKNSAGTTESKEVNEAASKKINGVTVAVTTADETNLKLSATVVVGSEKVTLEDGSAVKLGEDDTSVDGTLVDFETGNPNNMTALTISYFAPESDEDAIVAGSSFVDPIYGTIKLDFAGFNIGTDSASREKITVGRNSDDKLDLTFTDHRGYTKTFQWVKDIAGNSFASFGTGYGPARLMIDDDNRNISVLELEALHYNEVAIVGNEDEGHMIKLTGVDNSSDTDSSNTDGDKVEFTDVFSGDKYGIGFTGATGSWASDGIGSMIVGGRTYSVYLLGDASNATEEYKVFVDYPDSTANNATNFELIVFPTIETSKGAKVMFYEPTIIPLRFGNTTDGTNQSITGQTVEKNISKIMIPDGDGYESAYIQNEANSMVGAAATNMSVWEITVDGATGRLNTSTNGPNLDDFTTTSVNWSVGALTFGFTNMHVGNNSQNETTIYLVEPDGAGFLNSSAVIVWEEKDDNVLYHSNIIAIETGRTGDDGLGVDTSASGSTWNNDSASWQTSRASDSKITDAGDLWGTIITYDSGDSDQPTAEISYPDEQIYANLYMGAIASAVSVTGTTSATQLGDILVKDTEISSVQTKNLIVVGGSCINSVAAKLLGSTTPKCSADFTSLTGIGTGQFLIQSFGDAYTTGKIALLVAGYEAADTANAATYLKTKVVDTTAGTKYKGTSATSAELVTTTTTA